MPALNYEDAGALVDYEYIVGVITALYYSNDTCDLTGLCGTLSNVPIFYHCSAEAQVRDNGALVGAALGFTVGDEVVVLKAHESAASDFDDLTKIKLRDKYKNASDSKYFVVAHYNGIQECGTDYLIVASGSWNSYTEAFIPELWFIWDIAVDDYFEGVYYNDWNTGLKTYLTRDRFPVIYGVTSGKASWTNWKAAKGIFDYTYLYPDELDLENFDGRIPYNTLAAKGDFVYVKDNTWLWTRIKKVEYNAEHTQKYLILEDNSILYAGFNRLTISVSMPLFYMYESRVPYNQTWQGPDSTPECNVKVTYHNGSVTVRSHWSRPSSTVASATANVAYQGPDAPQGGVEADAYTSGSISMSSNTACPTPWYAEYVCVGKSPVLPPGIHGVVTGNFWSGDVLMCFYGGTIGGIRAWTRVTNLNKAYLAKYTGPFGDYERLWYDEMFDSYSAIDVGSYSFQTTELSHQSSTTTTGKQDPLGEMSYTVQTLPVPSPESGLVYVTTLQPSAQVTSRTCSQVYSYPLVEGEIPIHAQSLKRKNKDADNEFTRSAKLEAAIKTLVSRSNPTYAHAVILKAYVFSTPRTV